MEAYYTIQPADLAEGLGGIARQIYGSVEHWLRLYQVNSAVIGANPNIVQAGQQLVVPGLDEAGFPARLHTVKPWDIAGGLPAIVAGYPDCMLSWQQIYAINRGVIGDNPRMLSPGQRLLILIN
ncbi:MAG TPA: hypothetical protein VFS21_15740 [Roseiflexaceae bacterium]|nr:hypothetical protein [Roseiflexaceae bacterium]